MLKAEAGTSFLACQLPKLPCDAPTDLLIQQYPRMVSSTLFTCPITYAPSQTPLPRRPSLRTSGGWSSLGLSISAYGSHEMSQSLFWRGQSWQWAGKGNRYWLWERRFRTERGFARSEPKVQLAAIASSATSEKCVPSRHKLQGNTYFCCLSGRLEPYGGQYTLLVLKTIRYYRASYCKCKCDSRH